MAKLVGQLLDQEAAPGEGDAHVLYHQQADDAGVVGQETGGGNGRAEKGRQNEGGGGAGVGIKPERLAHASGNGHEQDIDRDDIGNDGIEQKARSQKGRVQTYGGSAHPADDEQGDTTGKSGFVHQNADKHAAHGQPRDGRGPAHEGDFRRADAHDDIVHQEQHGHDEIGQQIKGEHADGRDGAEPVVIQRRIGGIMEGPGYKGGQQEAEAPAEAFRSHAGYDVCVCHGFSSGYCCRRNIPELFRGPGRGDSPLGQLTGK